MDRSRDEARDLLGARCGGRLVGDLGAPPHDHDPVADAEDIRHAVADEDDGDALRLVVIDKKVVAAALRLPAEGTGTGKHTIGELIEAQSRRRAAATGGESRIPMDVVTETTVREAGYSFDDVLPEGQRLRVRRTANLHQGGTIHDVTATVHQELCRVAVASAEAIGIPVTGIDLLVPDVTRPDYVFIEANERPGLANHEPQPTAAAFVDFLFPGQPGIPSAWTPDEAVAGS